MMLAVGRYIFVYGLNALIPALSSLNPRFVFNAQLIAFYRCDGNCFLAYSANLPACDMKLDLVLALLGTISLDESLRMFNASTTAEGNRHGDRVVGCFVLATVHPPRLLLGTSFGIQCSVSFTSPTFMG